MKKLHHQEQYIIARYIYIYMQASEIVASRTKMGGVAGKYYGNIYIRVRQNLRT